MSNPVRPEVNVIFGKAVQEGFWRQDFLSQNGGIIQVLDEDFDAGIRSSHFGVGQLDVVGVPVIQWLKGVTIHCVIK